MSAPIPTVSERESLSLTDQLLRALDPTDRGPDGVCLVQVHLAQMLEKHSAGAVRICLRQIQEESESQIDLHDRRLGMLLEAYTALSQLGHRSQSRG